MFYRRQPRLRAPPLRPRAGGAEGTRVRSRVPGPPPRQGARSVYRCTAKGRAALGLRPCVRRLRIGGGPATGRRDGPAEGGASTRDRLGPREAFTSHRRGGRAGPGEAQRAPPEPEAPARGRQGPTSRPPVPTLTEETPPSSRRTPYAGPETSPSALRCGRPHLYWNYSLPLSFSPADTRFFPLFAP